MAVCYLISKESGKKHEFRSTRCASAWLQRNRGYVSSCLYYKHPIKHGTTGEEFYCIYKEQIMAEVRQGNWSHEQPCYTCKKATGGCSWSRWFKPVKGWKAKPTVIHHGHYHGKERTLDSYAIIECPEYERG